MVKAMAMAMTLDVQGHAWLWLYGVALTVAMGKVIGMDMHGNG